MLRTRFVYYAAAFLLALAPMAAFGQGTAFQWDLGGNQGLYTHTSDDTSDFAPVFQFDPASTIAVDFDAADTLFYVDLTGLTYGTVDTVNAQLVPTGPITGDVPVGAAGMSIDPSTGLMWCVDGATLWSVDLGTGVATLGPAITGHAGSMWAIAINSTGDLYGYDIADNTLYAVDKVTGVATAVGTSAQDGVFSNNGMDFDASDVLYHGLYTGGGTGDYGTWDLNTGVFTTIASHVSFPTLTPGQGLGGGMGIDSLGNVNMWNFWGGTFCQWEKDNPLTTLNELPQMDSAPPFPLPVSLFGMEFDDSTGILYGIDFGTLELGEINPATGEWTVLFPLSGAPTGTITDMSYDIVTNTMYVIDTGSLYTIDLNSGFVTLVAAFTNSNPIGGAPNIAVGLGVDPLGNMFLFSSGDDTLWSVDPVTAICTSVGTLAGTTNNNFIQGMDFDPNTGVLWHSAIDADGSGVIQPGFYGSWDTVTGVFTPIDTLQGIGGSTPSDLYEFKLAIELEPPIVDVTPDSLTIVTGVGSGGGLPELQASDNVDFRASRNPAGLQSRVVYEIGTTSPTDTPSALTFTIEESVFARGNVSRQISLFNYQTSSFELVDTRNASRFGDRVDVIVLTGDVTRFVEPGTGAMLARVRYDGPSARANFTANTDHIFWTVTN